MSQVQIISLNQTQKWYDVLSLFKASEPSFLPEYYRAYLSRDPSSRALLWFMQEDDFAFCYPFVISSISDKTDAFLQKYHQYKDISSVYGYGGPLVNEPKEDFLAKAWNYFDKWAQNEKIIAEFTRFSPYSQNHRFANPGTNIEINRQLAISYLPDSQEKFWQLLDSKTRNMIRKAQKQGLHVEEMPLNHISLFQELYLTTMNRNAAADFFYYDIQYYKELMALDNNAIKLFGVYHQSTLVSAVIILIHNHCALYHLSATDSKYRSLGAGNLALWHISNVLIEQGISFFNLGGGRTTNVQDPLWKYKRSNSTSETDFYIGKRIINAEIYHEILDAWNTAKDQTCPPSSNLLFYRL
ncbi:MAG: peptidoglycan bridge formation glycyltransferase FemA/FemB family protein [Candidatus Berkiella sp.]